MLIKIREMVWKNPISASETEGGREGTWGRKDVGRAAGKVLVMILLGGESRTMR